MNKIKTYLIRRLIGTDKLEDVVDSARITTYGEIIKFVAERIAQDSETYTAEFFAQKVGDFKPDFLISAIQVNKNLTTEQKEKLIYILQAPAMNQASYLR